MNYNPFVCGNKVSSDNFFDRRQPLNRVKGRLLSGGQSTAIIGEPRTGKTSLLCYLAAPEKRTELYGLGGERLLFQYMDMQMLSGHFTPFDFWVQALTPIRTEEISKNSDSLLNRQYTLCCDNHFGTFTLETLFRLLKQMDWRLVLLLDEFDTLISHPILNSAEFFGGLRSLASRSDGALALVVGSRLPVSQLNTRTQEFNPTGSPYFNIFSEIILGSFPDRDVSALLDRAGDRFTLWDKRAIRGVAGGHPFLLQAAASAMWEAHEEGITDLIERRLAMANSLYRENKDFFANTWQVWASTTRKAFTAVALTHTAHMLPGREFLTDSFIEDMCDFGPELTDLTNAGLLIRDEQMQCGWRVVPQAMLWWLTDELVRAVRRNDLSFEDWLRVQELDNLLTKKEREKLSQATQGLVKVLRNGAVTLIEAFAKGLGESWAGGT